MILPLPVVALLLTLVHDPNEPFADWFSALRMPGTGMSCCSYSRDCAQIDVYEPTEGGYRALFEGVWVDVPRRVVLDRTDNPTGRAVLCVGHVDGKPVARCFIRAAEG